MGALVSFGVTSPYAPASDIMALALEGVNGQTLRAYRADWAHYSAFTGVHNAEDSVRDLVSKGQGYAQRMLFAYRQKMISDQLAPATINRHLAALRYVVRVCRRSGVIDWAVDVQGVTLESMRDTRGPGHESWMKMIDLTTDLRDRLVLRLLHDMALRRAEVVALKVSDYAPNPAPARLWVLGKGNGEKTALTAPSAVVAAIEAYLSARVGGGESLTGTCYATIPRIVQRAAKRAGMAQAHPHGLRHAGVTRALDLSGGDVRRVRQFARHKKIETTMIYDDARVDNFGTIAEMVGGE